MPTPSRARSTWWSLALWLFVLPVAAPLPAAGSAPETINRYARAWTSEDGLRGSQVWALQQDRAGYLWLGTNEGLVRFDGVEFRVWREFGGTPLPGGSVRALSLARDGAIWIGFGATGSVSRVFEGQLRTYSNDDGLPGSNVLAVLEDRSGTAWAGSLVGLFQLTNDRWQRVPAEHGLPTDLVSALFEDRLGHVWVGTAQGPIVGEPVNTPSRSSARWPWPTSARTPTEQSGALATMG